MTPIDFFNYQTGSHNRLMELGQVVQTAVSHGMAGRKGKKPSKNFPIIGDTKKVSRIITGKELQEKWKEIQAFEKNGIKGKGFPV